MSRRYCWATETRQKSVSKFFEMLPVRSQIKRHWLEIGRNRGAEKFVEGNRRSSQKATGPPSNISLARELRPTDFVLLLFRRFVHHSPFAATCLKVSLYHRVSVHLFHRSVVVTHVAATDSHQKVPSPFIHAAVIARKVPRNAVSVQLKLAIQSKFLRLSYHAGSASFRR